MLFMKRSILKAGWVSPVLVVGVTITAIGMAYYSYQTIYNLTLDSLKKNALLATQTGAQDLDLWLSNLKLHAETLANTEVVRSLDWTVTEPYLRERTRSRSGPPMDGGMRSGPNRLT
jgi:hypothetical protein